MEKRVSEAAVITSYPLPHLTGGVLFFFVDIPFDRSIHVLSILILFAFSLHDTGLVREKNFRSLFSRHLRVTPGCSCGNCLHTAYKRCLELGGVSAVDGMAYVR